MCLAGTNAPCRRNFPGCIFPPYQDGNVRVVIGDRLVRDIELPEAGKTNRIRPGSGTAQRDSPKVPQLGKTTHRHTHTHPHTHTPTHPHTHTPTHPHPHTHTPHTTHHTPHTTHHTPHTTHTLTHVYTHETHTHAHMLPQMHTHRHRHTHVQIRSYTHA